MRRNGRAGQRGLHTHRPNKACCGARTRQGKPCAGKALANGRCRNHGGLSTGANTAEGRRKLSEVQKARWARIRDAREI